MIGILTDFRSRPQWQNPDEKIVPVPTEKIETVSAYPVEISIPAIEVKARVQQVGVTALGAMDVPSNTTDTGWFKHGPPPGTIGSAVISGHFNGKNNEPGVFARLNIVTIGDLVHVTTDTGEILTFKVREVRDYDPGRADEVFTQNDIPHLNLITCEGVWDPKSESYSKRRVVFTDFIE